MLYRGARVAREQEAQQHPLARVVLEDVVAERVQSVIHLVEHDIADANVLSFRVEQLVELELVLHGHHAVRAHDIQSEERTAQD